ncbi:MAG: putative ABC transporter permease protein [Chloroflexi bacterium ADurb.Bin180]|nr:MAG: putative ABC transporter permease protein [Chloroflexi bacterium ADurb.Bin180]HNR96650.1 iron ABC transporter permease [Anaerolineae bacterium]HQJ51382.1 iron ABC transporter permease [Anaerolineae bacterium]
MEKTYRSTLVVLFALALAVGFGSLFLGRYPVSPATMVRALASRVLPIARDWGPTVETVIFNIRVPRVILAMCVGAGLSICGAAFQGMFQNPLVSPDILGVTAGGGFGAALAILLSGRAAMIQLSAIVFGIIAVVLTYLISRVYKTTPTLMLVLAGIVVGSIFSALLSLAKYVADPRDKLPTITFWLMGSLATVSRSDVVSTAPPVLVGMLALLLVRWRINLLSMGDAEARALGVNTEVLKTIIIVASTVITACSVSVCGVIGWVGLVIPHIGRMLVGPDHRVLLPASLALGAIYLTLIDDVARSLMGAEIPLGILTAIIGAPFFALMLRRTKGGWS